MTEQMHTPTDALADIAAERRRQIKAEGWTPEHDDQHADGSIARAAAAYALSAALTTSEKGSDLWLGIIKVIWRWDWSWWKPKDRRRDLVRAGALIVAEIERLDRAALSHQVQS